jgi:hypothetical protein
MRRREENEKCGYYCPLFLICIEKREWVLKLVDIMA